MNKIRWHSSTHEHKGTSGFENQMRRICIFHTARYREKRPPLDRRGLILISPERSAEPPAPASDSIPQTWWFNALMSVCVSLIKRLHFWNISQRHVSPAGGTVRPRVKGHGWHFNAAPPNPRRRTFSYCCAAVVSAGALSHDCSSVGLLFIIIKYICICEEGSFSSSLTHRAANQ